MSRTSDSIDELYAWVIEGANGVEMIATPYFYNGYSYPLVSTSEELARIRMLPLAAAEAREAGSAVKLVKFVRAEVVQ